MTYSFPGTIGNRADDSQTVERVLREHGPQLMGVVAARLGWTRDRANDALAGLRSRERARYVMVERTSARGNPYRELLWSLNDQ